LKGGAEFNDRQVVARTADELDTERQAFLIHAGRHTRQRRSDGSTPHFVRVTREPSPQFSPHLSTANISKQRTAVDNPDSDSPYSIWVFADGGRDQDVSIENP
jgi:hypothetical protein